MADIVDAIIVGAGLSGLQAALDLHESGRSIIVLEARDRVGGKTNSTEREDGKGSHVWGYCERFNLTPVKQNIKGLVASEDADGSCHMFPFGELPKFEKSDVDGIVKLRDMAEAASLNPETFQKPKRDELDSISLEQWCRDFGVGTKSLLTARVWCRGTLGQDPCEVSALAYLEICRGAMGLVNLRHDGKHGAQYLRVQEGTQSISIGISKLLPAGTIKLSTPVASITQQTPKLYTVTTSNGDTFKARKVIISIPGPTYKNIIFDPPLPQQKLLYTTAARYGTFVKHICLFKMPFWNRQGACGLAQSFRGPINHCRDTSVPDRGNYALTTFLCAGPGRKWLSLIKEERTEVILKQLGSLFGVGYETVKSEFIDSITAKWTEDRWAGWGCPFAATPPGVIGDGWKANQKLGGLYFVGTELTDEWRGYMEGALRSGKRGAALAMADLQTEDVRL
ncbi:related to amine oxidase [Phialocephala subalpina]|uniref:Amine oxidase n=1 Tax=Phialocephala subalpina TaxID=576137 RepID=A0A1L7XLA0_9HELO|nr:related to amine oxidase [Phialocephala subalpina]